jgi:hypothetical protein
MSLTTRWHLGRPLGPRFMAGRTMAGLAGAVAVSVLAGCSSSGGGTTAAP